MKLRRGVTMLELMFVMSACTGVITLSGLLMSRAMRVETRARAQMGVERTTLRLSEQFRNDCHQARNAVVASSPQEGAAMLRIDLANGRKIEYMQSGGTLNRVESGGEQPEWREEYVFPEAIDWSVREHRSPRRIEFTLHNKPDITSVVEGKQVSNAFNLRVSLVAEAVVGRDLRFEALQTGKDKSE